MTRLNPCCVSTAMMCVVLFATFPAYAASVVLEPMRDNSIFETTDGSDRSNGVGTGLFAGTTGDTGDFMERRALLLFDVSGEVSAGATITSVSLQLIITRVPREPGDSDMDLYRLLSDWGEGASVAPGQGGMGAAAEIGDATWDHTLFDTDLWAMPGGDFQATVSATAIAGGNGTTVTWSSASMVDDVQDWSDNPTENFGWIVLGPMQSFTARRFGSRESTIPAQRPLLTITYDEGGEGEGEGEGEGDPDPKGSGCYASRDHATASHVSDLLLFLGALLALTVLGSLSPKGTSKRK